MIAPLVSFPFLKRAFVNIVRKINKKVTASKEVAFSQTFLSEQATIQKYSGPFEYYVVDNVFTEEAYAKITDYVHSVKNRGLSKTPTNLAFRPFKYVNGYLEKYGGYFYAPHPNENEVTRFLFSATWNQYVENLVQVYTNNYISTTLHYHTAGNPSGWPHSDFQRVYFDEKDLLPSGMRFQSDSSASASSLTTARGIGVIYYCCNKLDDEDGGGTFLYKNPKEQPFATVAPRNNRLLIFEISPESFHAFEGNKKDRLAFVQWFHRDLEDMRLEFPNNPL